MSKFIFAPSCVSCHNSGSASGGVALDSYNSVISKLDLVQSQISSHQMPLPPAAALDSFQTSLLSNWIAEGAPEVASVTPGSTPISSPTPNPASPTPAPTPDLNAQAITTIRSNYNLFVQPLIQRACMDCHNINAKPEGFGTWPIVKGVEWKHIHAGTKALDFSRTFPDWSDQSSEPMFYLTQLKGVLVNNTMPIQSYIIFHELDGKLLRSNEKTIILNWIDNSVQLLNAAVTTPPTAKQYLNINCQGCHNGDIPSGGFILGSGKSIGGIPEVTPFQPLNSAVYLVLLQDPSARHGLPLMPYGGQASASDQKLVFDWINSGAN